MIGIRSGRFVLLPIVLFALTAGGENLEYDAFINKLSELNGSKSYQEAIQLVLSVWDGLPDKRFQLTKELSYLYRQTGELQKCMDVWESGNKQGFFYCLHPDIPIYKPFSSLERFKNISEVDMELRRQANRKSQMTYRIIYPDQYRTAKPYPLVIILHGGNSNFEYEMKHWRSPLLGKECLTAFIQSYRRFDYDTYGWMGNDPRAMKDLADIYIEISKKHCIDSSKVAVAGISAGALVAMEATFAQKIPVSGFLGICPDIKPDKFDRQEVAASAKSGSSGIMICGERDLRLDNQKRASQMLTEIGFNHRFIVVDGLGHWYPDNFPEVIDSALKEIFNRF